MADETLSADQFRVEFFRQRLGEVTKHYEQLLADTHLQYRIKLQALEEEVNALRSQVPDDAPTTTEQGEAP